MAEVYLARVRTSQPLSVGGEVEFIALDDRRLIGSVVDFDSSRAHVRVKQAHL